MQSKSLSINSYILTFIDDFSRICWVYFLKHKDELLGCFKEFKELVKNQSEHTIKYIRSDRGGEYASNEFSDF